MKKVSRNDNNIQMYLHCGKCIDEWKANPEIKTQQSPQDYQKVQAGWTKEGLQVWCVRHDCNIIHVDFEKQQFHADCTRQATEEEKALK